MCDEATCSTYGENTKGIRSAGLEEWRKNAWKFECAVCTKERERRHRVLPMLSQSDHSGQGDEQENVLKAEISIPEHLQDSLRSARFID